MDHTYFTSIMKVEQDNNNLAIINVRESYDIIGQRLHVF